MSTFPPPRFELLSCCYRGFGGGQVGTWDVWSSLRKCSTDSETSPRARVTSNTKNALSKNCRDPQPTGKKCKKRTAAECFSRVLVAISCRRRGSKIVFNVLRSRMSLVSNGLTNWMTKVLYLAPRDEAPDGRGNVNNFNETIRRYLVGRLKKRVQSGKKQ